jgi:hypothetical protein
MLKSKLNSVLIYGLLMTAMSYAAPAQAEQSGYDGQNGESRTIFLDPQQSLFLNLSGTDGAPGANGARPNSNRHGSWNNNDRDDDDDDNYNKHYPLNNSSQCHNSDVGNAAKNITMPNGESGLSSSKGGNGGNGGDLTIYYQNRLDLRQVLVDSSPGRGVLAVGVLVELVDVSARYRVGK